MNWGSLASNITFVLYVCEAIKEFIQIEDIAEQAARTYPGSFVTKIGKRKVPDTYIIVMALKEAMASNFRYVRGDWVNGWKLTLRGLKFAKEVERRKLKK